MHTSCLTTGDMNQGIIELIALFCAILGQMDAIRRWQGGAKWSIGSSWKIVERNWHIVVGVRGRQTLPGGGWVLAGSPYNVYPSLHFRIYTIPCQAARKCRSFLSWGLSFGVVGARGLLGPSQSFGVSV